MEEHNKFKQGDNVIIVDSPTWKSLIGKSAVVVKNDADPNYGEGHKKIKVDYEDGAVGWFWPHQLALDNDINNIEDAKKHLNSIVFHNKEHISAKVEIKHIQQILQQLNKLPVHETVL